MQDDWQDLFEFGIRGGIQDSWNLCLLRSRSFKCSLNVYRSLLQARELLIHFRMAGILSSHWFGRDLQRNHPTNPAIWTQFESALISWLLYIFFCSQSSSRASFITNYFCQVPEFYQVTGSVAAIQQSPERCRKIKSNGTKLRQLSAVECIQMRERRHESREKREKQQAINVIICTSARTRTNHSNRYRGCNLFNCRKLLPRPKALHQTHANEESYIVRPDSVWHPFHNIWQ